MNRKEVYKAIDTEMDYVQEMELVSASHVVEDFPLAAGMEAIAYNMRKANESWYVEQAPYPNAMKYLRKIAGICVKMGVKYDMPERIYDLRQEIK